MDRCKYFLSMVVLIWLQAVPLAAQLVEIPSSELITEKDGFPFNVGSCLIQDNTGFLWVGSIDGLARYDGYSFVTLQHKSSQSNSLPNNSITTLAIDNQGMIWAGHIGGHVSRINPKTFEIWSTKIEGAQESNVNKIFCDRKGTVWIGVSHMGLFRFDGKQSIRHVISLTNLPQNNLVPIQIYNSVTDFYETKEGTFWLASPNGLYKFRPADSTLIHITSLGSINDPSSITQLLPDGSGGFWCSTWAKGMMHYDPNTNNYQQYTFEEGGYKGTKNIIYTIIKKNDNEIWGGTGAIGVLVFNTVTKKFSFTNGAKGSNSPFACGYLMKDRSGIIWALSDKGLHKWDIAENYFTFYKVNVIHDDNSNYYGTTSFLNDQKNKRKIIGTIFADGVHVITSDGKEKILSIPWHPKAEPYNVVNDLMQDKDGNTYVLTRDFLLLLTPDNRLNKVEGINALLPPTTVPFYYKMIQSRNGDLWVLSSRNGLFHLNSKINKWEYFPAKAPYPQIDNRAYRIAEDNSGKIWLMNSRIGLTVYDPSTQTWANYKHEAGKPGSLVSNLITGMTITPRGDIFVSTVEGISKFNFATNSFENHTISTGLPTETFYSLASDDEGILWVSSNKGLFGIDPATWNLQVFSYKDGLKGIYSDFTPFNGGHGKMYLTTYQGFYSFTPSEIKNSKKHDPPVKLTSIKNLSSRKVEYNPSGKLLVDYDDNSLAIEYAALNFYNPLRNRYLYKMEGLDKDWIETTDHSVNYSGIPSGSYTFLVRLVGSDSSVSQCSIGITVATPFWSQDWFRTLLVTLGLATVYLFYRVRLNQVRKEEKIKREYSKKLAEVEMKALKAQMNPHFIFNSLNSINRYIVKSEPERASLYLTKFSKLIRLILDNSNHKIISLENELSALRLYIELEALRFNEKFIYTIQLNGDLNPMCVGVPPMIIQPFVENAIWHGLLHKEELGRLDIQFERYGSGLKCTVVDNGVGREKASELKSKSVNKAKSYGMKITNDRLSMLNGESKVSTVEIVDLKDDQGNATGTKVIVKILSAELEPEF